MSRGGWNYHKVRIYLPGIPPIARVCFEMVAEKDPSANAVWVDEHALCVLTKTVALRPSGESRDACQKASAWWNTSGIARVPDTVQYLVTDVSAT